MDALSLSVKPRRICETRDGKQIIGPLSVFKLESGRTTMVNTGIKIDKCPTGSLVKITPCDEYADKLRFVTDTFEATFPNEIILQVTNVSDQFIRLDPKYHPMFIAELITEDAQVEDVVSEVLDDVVESVVNEEEVNDEVKEEPKEEPKEEIKEEVPNDEPKKEVKKPRLTKRATKKKINVKM
jgi:hypothetical protein